MPKLSMKEVQNIKRIGLFLGDTMSGTGKNLIDTIEAQQQEIEQLQLQMVQAARGSADIVNLAEENTRLQKALKQAKEAIHTLHGILEEHEPNWYLLKHHMVARKAIAVIDKAIGDGAKQHE